MQKVRKDLWAVCKNYRLSKVKMTDEDVNLNTSKISKYRLYSIFQNAIYMHLNDFRLALIQEQSQEKEEQQVQMQFQSQVSPFNFNSNNNNNSNNNLSIPTKNFNINNNPNSNLNLFPIPNPHDSQFLDPNLTPQSNRRSGMALVSEYDELDQKKSSENITDYLTKAEEIVCFMGVCRQKNYEVKADSLVHMLNYLFFHRPEGACLEENVLEKAALNLDVYVNNLILSEISTYDLIEDSKYAHLSQQQLLNIKHGEARQFKKQANSNEQDNEIGFTGTTTVNVINPDYQAEEKTCDFDCLQIEALWEYLCQYAKVTFSKEESREDKKKRIHFLHRLVMSTLQLSIFRQGTEEQMKKMRLSTLLLLEDVFLDKYINVELMKIEKFVFLRYLLLLEFRNRRFLEEVMNRVISYYHHAMPLFIEKLFSMFCDNYPEAIKIFIRICWSSLLDKQLRINLFERVLRSTEGHIFTREERSAFIDSIKKIIIEKNNPKSDEEVIFACISNEQYSGVLTQRDITSRINSVLTSKDEVRILRLEPSILKYILNSQAEQCAVLSNSMVITFKRQKEMTKQIISLIYSEMKTSNRHFCLKLLHIIYTRIFHSAEWQELKYYLFLSFPRYLLKQLQNLEEQQDVERVRASHHTNQRYQNQNNLKMKKNDGIPSRKNSSNLREAGNSNNNSPLIGQQQSRRSRKSAQPLKISTGLFPDQPSSVSRFHPSMPILENNQRKVLFLLRLAYTIILQQSVLDEKRFDELFFSNATDRLIPFANMEEMMPTAAFLFYNGFFDSILQVIMKYKLLNNNEVLLLEVSKMIGYLDQLSEKANSIQQLSKVLMHVEQFSDDVQNSLVDLIISMSLEQGQQYLKTVQEYFGGNISNHGNNNQTSNNNNNPNNTLNNNNLASLSLNNSKSRANLNLDIWNRKLEVLKQHRIKIPFTFQLLLKLINQRALGKDPSVQFLCVMSHLCKLEYNQVLISSSCTGQILKIIKTRDDLDAQKLLFSIVESLSTNINVNVLAKLLKFFRGQETNKKQNLQGNNNETEGSMTMSTSMNYSSLTPRCYALPNIASNITDTRSFSEHDSECLKSQFLDMISIMKKLCNRNSQSASTNNANYLDFDRHSFVEANKLGAFDNTSFSFVITFRLHDILDSVTDTSNSAQYFLKLSSINDKICSSLEVVIEKSQRDSSYGISIRIRDEEIQKNGNNNSQKHQNYQNNPGNGDNLRNNFNKNNNSQDESWQSSSNNCNSNTQSIFDEQSNIKQSDYFKVDLEISKWYLLGICYTKTPPNNHYQSGKFYLFLNGNHVFYSGTNRFDKEISKIKTIDALYLGNNESRQQGLQGQISNFFMSNSFMEGKDIFQMFQFYQEGRITNYPKYFQDIHFSLQLNLSAFTNKDFQQTKEVPNGLESEENVKKQTSFFSSLFNKSDSSSNSNSNNSQRSTKFLSVKAGGGVFLIQKMTLVETCLQVGNLDIFFYIIELVTHNPEFTPHQSNEIISEIFLLLSEFYQRYREYLETLEKQRLESLAEKKCGKFLESSDDLKSFLQKGGFLIISKLLYEYIGNKKPEAIFFDCLARFIETLKPQQELYLQGTVEVIMNMELWCLTDKNYQERVFAWITSALNQMVLLKYLIQQNYLYTILHFQNSVMFHSDSTDIQKEMRSRLNDVIIILITATMGDRLGQGVFKSQMNIFYRFFVFTLQDRKTASIKHKRMLEFLQMYLQIIKQKRLTGEDLLSVVYTGLEGDEKQNQSCQNVVQILHWVLRDIKTRRQSNLEQVEITFKTITATLKSIKETLDAIESAKQAHTNNNNQDNSNNFGNSDKTNNTNNKDSSENTKNILNISRILFNDLKEIMVMFAEVIFCYNESGNITEDPSLPPSNTLKFVNYYQQYYHEQSHQEQEQLFLLSAQQSSSSPKRQMSVERSNSQQYSTSLKQQQQQATQFQGSSPTLPNTTLYNSNQTDRNSGLKIQSTYNMLSQSNNNSPVDKLNTNDMQLLFSYSSMKKRELLKLYQAYKPRQENTYVQLLRRCIYLQSPKMNLQLLVTILNRMFKDLQDHARDLLVDQLIRLDSPAMLESISFEGDFVKLLEKLYVTDRNSFAKLSSKYLCFRFSTSLDKLLVELLGIQTEDGVMTVLRFLDCGMKVALDDREREKYGCSVQIPPQNDPEKSILYCVFRIVLFLEDYFALKQSILMTPIPSISRKLSQDLYGNNQNKNRQGVASNEIKLNLTSKLLPQSSQESPEGAYVGQQSDKAPSAAIGVNPASPVIQYPERFSTSDSQEPTFIEEDQKSAVFLSILKQCFDHLKLNEVLYSTIPQLPRLKEKLKFQDHQAQTSDGFSGMQNNLGRRKSTDQQKQTFQYNSDQKQQQQQSQGKLSQSSSSSHASNKNTNPNPQHPTTPSSLKNYGKVGSSMNTMNGSLQNILKNSAQQQQQQNRKHLSNFGGQIKGGGIMRVVVNCLIKVMGSSVFEEDYIQSLNMLATLAFELQNPSRIYENINFLKNPYIDYQFSVSEGEDIIAEDIRSYIFASSLHLLQKRFISRSKEKSSSSSHYYSGGNYLINQSSDTMNSSTLINMKHFKRYSTPQVMDKYNIPGLDVEEQQRLQIEQDQQSLQMQKNTKMNVNPFEINNSSRQILSLQSLDGNKTLQGSATGAIATPQIERMNTIQEEESMNSSANTNRTFLSGPLIHFQLQRSSSSNRMLNSKSPRPSDFSRESEQVIKRTESNYVCIEEAEEIEQLSQKKGLIQLQPFAKHLQSVSIHEQRLLSQDGQEEEEGSEIHRDSNQSGKESNNNNYDDRESQQDKKDFKQQRSAPLYQSFGLDEQQDHQLQQSQQQQQDPTKDFSPIAESEDNDDDKANNIDGDYSDYYIQNTPQMSKLVDDNIPLNLQQTNLKLVNNLSSKNSNSNSLHDVSFNNLVMRSKSSELIDCEALVGFKHNNTNNNNINLNVNMTNQNNDNSTIQLSQASYQSAPCSGLATPSLGKAISRESIQPKKLNLQDSPNISQKPSFPQDSPFSPSDINLSEQILQDNKIFSAPAQPEGDNLLNKDSNSKENKRKQQMIPQSENIIPNNIQVPSRPGTVTTVATMSDSVSSAQAEGDLQKSKVLMQLLLFLSEFLSDHGDYLIQRLEKAIPTLQKVYRPYYPTRSRENSLLPNDILMLHQTHEESRVTQLQLKKKKPLKKIIDALNQYQEALQKYQPSSESQVSLQSAVPSSPSPKIPAQQEQLMMYQQSPKTPSSSTRSSWNQEISAALAVLKQIVVVCGNSTDKRKYNYNQIKTVNQLNRLLRQSGVLSTLVDLYNKESYYQIQLVYKVLESNLKESVGYSQPQQAILPFSAYKEDYNNNNNNNSEEINSNELSTIFDQLLAQIKEKHLEGIRQQNQVAAKWISRTKNLESRKGIWFKSVKAIGNVFYKLRRHCDEYGRMFFICPDLSKDSDFYSRSNSGNYPDGLQKNANRESINIPSLINIERKSSLSYQNDNNQRNSRLRRTSTSRSSRKSNHSLNKSDLNEEGYDEDDSRVHSSRIQNAQGNNTTQDMSESDISSLQLSKQSSSIRFPSRPQQPQLGQQQHFSDVRPEEFDEEYSGRTSQRFQNNDHFLGKSQQSNSNNNINNLEDSIEDPLIRKIFLNQQNGETFSFSKQEIAQQRQQQPSADILTISAGPGIDPEFNFLSKSLQSSHLHDQIISSGKQSEIQSSKGEVFQLSKLKEFQQSSLYSSSKEIRLPTTPSHSSTPSEFTKQFNFSNKNQNRNTFENPILDRDSASNPSKFQRSNKKRCFTVAGQTSDSVLMSSMKKTLDNKYLPTKEQIEKSLVTPQRKPLKKKANNSPENSSKKASNSRFTNKKNLTNSNNQENNQLVTNDNDKNPEQIDDPKQNFNDPIQRSATSFIPNGSFESEYVTLKNSCYGYITIGEEGVQFSSYKDRTRDVLDTQKTLYGSHPSSLVAKNLSKKLQFIDITSVHSRRFNMTEIAVEIFTLNSKSYLFNLFTPKKKDEFFVRLQLLKDRILQKAFAATTTFELFLQMNRLGENNIGQQQQQQHQHNNASPDLKIKGMDASDFQSHGQQEKGNKMMNMNFQGKGLGFGGNNGNINTTQVKYQIQQIASIELIQDREEHFKQKKFTEKWKKGELSNFEYLMLVNMYSSRSFNDITQYPIFPWIFNRYDSQDLVLNDPTHYRDLSKPIGALNPERLQGFQDRYDSSKDDNDERSGYFYSSHYSSQAFIYNFLIRIEPFTSLHWDFMSQKFDCPQRLFYSVPASWFSCMTNSNDLREITPEFFYLPEFLKSKPSLHFGFLPNGRGIDSVELPSWANSPEHFIAIHRKGLESPYVTKDLNKWIDLIFGKKQRSSEDFNIFHPCTYPDLIFKECGRKDIQQQIIQMNMSMLVGQCPARLFSNSHESKLPANLDIFSPPIAIKQDKSEIILKLTQSVNKMNYLYEENTSKVYGIKTSELLKSLHEGGGNLRSKSVSKQYEFKERGINTNYQLSNIFFAFSETFLFVAGFQDCSFRMYQDFQQIEKIHYHKKPICIIRGSEKHGLIVCASEDLRISVWDVSKIGVNCSLSHLFFIYGHNSTITTLALQDSQKLIFSSDKDRVCHLHTYKEKFMSSFILRQVEQNDYAHLAVFSPDGSTILLGTHQNRLQLYNLNGELLLNYHLIFSSPQNKDSSNYIQQIEFYLEYSIILCTSQGEIQLLEDYTKYIFNKQERYIEQNDHSDFKTHLSLSSKKSIVGFAQVQEKERHYVLCFTKLNGIQLLSMKSSQ